MFGNVYITHLVFYIIIMLQFFSGPFDVKYFSKAIFIQILYRLRNSLVISLVPEP